MKNVLTKLSAALNFAQDSIIKLSIICNEKRQPAIKKPDLKIPPQLASLLLIAFFALPIAANADVGGSGLDGITAFLKSLVQLLIFDWGYYIGILALCVQGYRWMTGHISLVEFGKWGFGICLVFFAPNLVSKVKDNAGSSLP